MVRIRTVNLNGMHILQQLRVEELLLRHTTENWFIYNSQSKQRSIVLGLSGKINELVDVSKASKTDVKLIRRYTGGGTVIVDHNTVFCSFIMNSPDAPCNPYPREIMAWSEKIYAPAFQRLNSNIRIGGNAQTITRDRFVHHTSFLYDYDTENMNLLLMPTKRPQYRSSRPHGEFLTKLSSYLDSPGQLEQLVKQSMGEYPYDIEEMSLPALETLVNNLKGNLSWEKLTRSMEESLTMIPSENTT